MKRLLLVLPLVAACGQVMPLADAGIDAGVDAGPFDAGVCAFEPENLASCVRGPAIYQPRSRDAGTSTWPACISDDGVFRQIGTSTPAASARALAFDSMAAKLWRNPNVPTPADFLSARDDYSVANGLASRVARRQDVTYPEIPGSDKFACQNDAGVVAAYPDRCAGPAKLKPIIDDAFQKAAAGVQPRVQAARLEAALLWFLHLSINSEVWTCSFDKKDDCDSAAGYYVPSLTRAQPQGLAASVNATGPGSHDAIFDALLAVRCWRDVDTVLPAANTTLYGQAVDQVGRATLRGMAVVVKERITRLGCTSGDDQLAAQEFVKLLGGFLDHAATMRAPSEAATLRNFTTAPSADPTARQAAITAIDAIFGCPY